MRSVTAAASSRDGLSTRGKVSGAPMRTRTLCGRMRQPRRIASVPMMATGTTGTPVSSARRPTPRRGRPSEPGRMRVPSGKIRTLSPRARIARAVSSMSWSPVPRSTGKAPSALSSQPCQRRLEQLALGHVVERPARDRGDDERVQEGAVVGGDDVRAVGGHVLAADARQAEVQVEERLQHGADQPVDDRLDALLAGALVQCAVVHVPSLRTTCGRAPRYSHADATTTRVLRGALAGAAAAGVWGAQQPLDKRVFGVDYDDAELLGSAFTRERGTAGDVRASATRCTSLNGAVVRRRLRRRLPGDRRPGRRARRARRPGRARRHLAADPLPRAPSTPSAPSSRSCGATAARSPRRPGATCCSAPLLGAIEERLNPPPGRGRAGRRGPLDLQRPRQRRAPRRHRAREGAHHRRDRVRRPPPRRRTAAPRATTSSSLARAPAPTCSTRPRPAAAVAAAAPDVVYHLAAQAHVGRSWEDPAGTLRDNLALAANVLEAVRAEAPGATVVAVSSGEVYGPPGVAARHRGRAAAPAEPVRGLQGGDRPARALLRRRARAARRRSRARSTTPARARSRSTRSRPSPARRRRADVVVTGNPDTRRDYTDVRDVVRAYRLLAERGDGRRGLQRLLRPDGVGRRAGRRCSARRPRGRPRPRARARGDGGPRLAREAARGDRLGAGDRARPTPCATPSPGGGTPAEGLEPPTP